MADSGIKRVKPPLTDIDASSRQILSLEKFVPGKSAGAFCDCVGLGVEDKLYDNVKSPAGNRLSRCAFRLDCPRNGAWR